MLSIFLGPLIVLCLGIVSSVWLMFALYLLAGIGMAGVGMGIMHDALHGSYSKNRRVNKIIGYSMNLLGANANVWKVQHNILHHTYTNIQEHDDDINAPFFLRFSPHAKRYWVHRYQHLYVWFFYGLSTLSWFAAKDYVRLIKYHKMGYFKGKNEVYKELAKIIAWKIVHISITLIIPLIMIPLSPWLIVLAFLSMHFLTGLSITIVFQAAHVVPSTDFPLPDETGLIANNWTIHQLATTSNFAPKNRLLNWFIGGLNYQVEHHLMPNISHVHYPQVSTIVERTAREFGLPYYSKKTFVGAVADHASWLKQLGRQ
ncbi:fatty acid desaturase family protein [Fulvivirga sedimenti]|uniref:Acyl-CoA desaturase n=1 Tax=Fulvivirga sedimenti TaxID=2879465 RepID=A0A9X1L121_9BACT|nr:acyl-CoA desaturase [Fulvivirga sedimenti]MCA6075442.1 acyl-CoA desaturase [Fulvivirga sedimenti]MCA6076619.1 acyl-CoA desaturase [Fulvivirga sedimenti]MCA6077747.1 acyl-CoA desaturase [Fulvivirga sedimenti]